jgi:hypothetical protein
MMQTATHTLHTLQIAVLRLSFGILMYALTCPPIHSYGPAIPASDHKERMGKEYDNADNACMRACPYTCQVCIFHATGRVCVAQKGEFAHDAHCSRSERKFQKLVLCEPIS